MRIIRVDIAPCEPVFSGDGYAMSFIRHRQLHHRLVRLTTEDGSTGIGELVRNPRFDPTMVSVLEDERLPRLVGAALADIPGMISLWRAEGKELQGLAFGVDFAMFDLIGRRLGMPVSSLLGGATVADVPEYLSLSCEAPEAMADVVRGAGAAFSVVQAKLGVGDLDADLDRVRAVLGAMAPTQALLADFNGALAPEDAIRRLPEIDDPRLIWEEPCDRYDDGARVARAIASPVMLDQCLRDAPTYFRAIKDQAAAALVIKADAIGGLSAGRTVRDASAAVGIGVRIDGYWAGPVASAAALHLAVGAPAATLIGSIDLTEPMETERPHKIRPRPGRIAPGPGAGLGTGVAALKADWRPIQ